MSEYVLTDSERQKVDWLRQAGDQYEGHKWCHGFANYLEHMYAALDEFRQAYYTEQQTGERAAIKLESFAAEIRFLREDIKQIADKMPDEGQIGMWKQAMLLLTMPPSQRPENEYLKPRNKQ